VPADAHGPDAGRLPASGQLRAVGLIVHPARDARALVACVVDWARERRLELVGLESEAEQLRGHVPTVADEALGAASELVLALGGDGTILRALALAAPHGVPVLGVNLGRVGFLAEVDEAELPAALAALDRGEAWLEPRMAVGVAATASGGEPLPRAGYNDVVLTRLPGHGPAAISVSVDGEPFARYRADAVIVATPTGSTAYNVSAGGPIVSPRVAGLVVTPVAPYAVVDRALVVDRHETVTLDVLPRSAPVLLEVDGRPAGQLRAGDGVRLTVVDWPALVVRLGGASFYARAREKLRLVEALERRGGDDAQSQ
jgi:NAD+ kinase